MAELLKTVPQIGPEELRRLGEIMTPYAVQAPDIVHHPGLVKIFKPLDPVEGRSRLMVLAHNNRN